MHAWQLQLRALCNRSLHKFQIAVEMTCPFLWQLSILTLAIEMPLANKTYCYCQVHHASVSRGQIAKFEILLQLPGSRLSDASQCSGKLLLELELTRMSMNLPTTPNTFEGHL